MCRLRNSYYDTGFVNWRAPIGLEALSNSYSCIEKLTFGNGFVIWLDDVPP
jgi:hypothetical protein